MESFATRPPLACCCPGRPARASPWPRAVVRSRARARCDDRAENGVRPERGPGRRRIPAHCMRAAQRRHWHDDCNAPLPASYSHSNYNRIMPGRPALPYYYAAPPLASCAWSSREPSPVPAETIDTNTYIRTRPALGQTMCCRWFSLLGGRAGHCAMENYEPRRPCTYVLAHAVRRRQGMS